MSYAVADDAPARTIIGGTTVRGPRIELDASSPTLIESPLRGGGWWNANGCCVASSAHRMALLPAEGAYRTFEMFVIDWAKADGNTVFRGDGSKATDYVGYGSEVRAATTGEVAGGYRVTGSARVNGDSLQADPAPSAQTDTLPLVNTVADLG